jgi:hypothetical protein
MENLIETVRTALRDDAEPIARRAGLVACRKLLAALEASTDDERTSAPVAPSNEAREAPPATAVLPSEATAAAPSSAPATHAAATAQASAPPIDPAAVDPAVVATLVASLGKLPPEQLLDLAIARLRAALPPSTTVSAPTSLRFQLIPLHHLERSK